MSHACKAAAPSGRYARPMATNGGTQFPDEIMDASRRFAFEIGQGPARVCDVGATNFKAFREVDLRPGPLTAIVGANAAGKSSLVDIFRFISDSLRLSLYTALERRGGVQAVRHSSPTRPRNCKIWIELAFADDFRGFYTFRVRSEAGGHYSVPEEICTLKIGDTLIASLTLKNGSVTERVSPFFGDPFPGLDTGAVEPTALGLPVFGTFPELAPLLRHLRALRTYSIVPQQLREWQDPDEGVELLPDGSNAASVLRNLADDDRRELMEMLAYVVPGILAVNAIHHGNKLTLRFTQRAREGKRNQFEALQMSDGTLRLLGILLALYQPRTPGFLAIEEPEATIHVAALQALIEVFQARSDRTQIVLTTHSADILDSIDVDAIHLVTASDGNARLAPVSRESRQAIQTALFTPGELLRSGALEPEH